MLHICDGDYEYDQIVFHDCPMHFLSVFKYLRDKYSAIARLSYLIETELYRLRGTHSIKNMEIARLKKLIKLYELDVPDKSFKGKIRKLKLVVGIMEKFKNDTHRERNIVHELVYPHIVDVLDDLKQFKIVLNMNRFKRGNKRHVFTCIFEYLRYTDEYIHSCTIEVEKRFHNKPDVITIAYLTDNEIETILRKIQEREEKKMNMQRYINNYSLFIYGISNYVYSDPIFDVGYLEWMWNREA